MNKVILMGRLTRDPDVRYSQSDTSMCIARYSLAVDRRRRRDENSNEPTADFINCVAFGRSGEFAERYFRKGLKVLITGRIQTGSYTNKDGVKVYTTDIVVEDQEFAESKAASQNSGSGAYQSQGGFNAAPPMDDSEAFGAGGFMNVPEGVDEDLPFN